MTEYHLHVNALALSSVSEINLRGCGLLSRPFVTSGTATTYTPLSHYSFKTTKNDEFRYTFESCRLILSADQSFVGYIEGEYVSGSFATEDSSDEEDDLNDLPTLRLKQPVKWREVEVHVSVRSSYLAEKLRQKNFYISRIVKEDVEWEIATAQGEATVMLALYNRLASRSWKSQGPLRIKMETLLNLYISPGFNWLPPQVVGFESQTAEK